MQELLQTYSVDEIAMFIVLLAAAVKGCGGFFDWLKLKYNEKFNKDFSILTKEEELEAHYIKSSEQHKESIELYDKLDKKIDNLVELFENRFTKIEKKIDVLTESDKDDIKSWLVEKYNFYKENPTRPISAHTMDTIEKRYSHYRNEGGNSYIEETIMPELRKMAKEESRV